MPRPFVAQLAGAEHAVIGNIVPDFPLINKSFNLSYSGQTRDPILLKIVRTGVVSEAAPRRAKNGARAPPPSRPTS
jgi:hypothetical protein